MTPWVLRLIIANVVVYMISMAVGAAIRPFVLVPAFILARPWTVVTYMFLHAGMNHLFFNMLGLYFFGPRLEQRLGGKAFLGLYFTSGITGALFSFLTPYSAVVGASGAVFGVFLGFALFWPRERIIVFPIPIPIEARVLVVILTVLSLFSGASGIGGKIAHFAHLGGFAGGYLFLKLQSWNSRAARFKRKAAAVTSGPGDLQRWSQIRREDLHPVNRDEFDRVIEKVKTGGAGNITAEERAFLNRFGAG